KIRPRRLVLQQTAAQTGQSQFPVRTDQGRWQVLATDIRPVIARVSDVALPAGQQQKVATS
ncbi:MAG: hypothetical protein ACWGQW_15990, partial [bacterium]